MQTKTKALLGASALLLPIVSRAEDPTPIYETVGGQVQTAITTFITYVGPVIGAVIIAAFALWLVPKVVRFITNAFNVGSGGGKR